jgi:SAM-dependent methyltransferase
VETDPVTLFSCRACGGHDQRLWLSDCKDYFLGVAGKTNYVECTNCLLVQQHPLPKNPKALYADYPIHAKKSRVHDAIRRRLFRDVYFDATNVSSILDYGCGDGWYLDSIRGKVAERVGFEHDPEHAARVAKALRIAVHSSLDTLPRGHFDAIALHHVFEHLDQPRQTLEALAPLLCPGGRLYLLVPNARSWEARLFGRKWHGLDPPRHIVFADRAQIEKLAHPAGLRVQQERKVSFPNTIAGSLAVLLLGRFNDLTFKLLLPISIVASKLFPGGSMAYVLIKAAA